MTTTSSLYTLRIAHGAPPLVADDPSEQPPTTPEPVLPGGFCLTRWGDLCLWRGAGPYAQHAEGFLFLHHAGDITLTAFDIAT
jgi:hypothetical protein